MASVGRDAPAADLAPGSIGNAMAIRCRHRFPDTWYAKIGGNRTRDGAELRRHHVVLIVLHTICAATASGIWLANDSVVLYLGQRQIEVGDIAEIVEPFDLH